MPSVEFLVLLSGIVGSLVVSIWTHYKITQWAASALAMQVQELNEALGEALQIVGNNPMAQENPLVGIIGRILEKQVDAPVKAKLVEQDEKGRFVKKIE